MEQSSQLRNLSCSRVVGIRVDATSYDDASRRIIEWSRARESRYVCVAAVNNVMEAHDHRDFRHIMEAADLVTPDGMPLVWCLRTLCNSGATRVYGPDLTRRLLTEAERNHLPIGLYGGSEKALEGLQRFIALAVPRARVVYACAPPFRPLTPEEDNRITSEIINSGVALLFVGLSTPKQERWMAAHRGKVPCTMIGVGAAFDFLSGHKPQAPRWMMQSGLEWLFRLITEPRRLWRRYLTQNPRFLALLAGEAVERLVLTVRNLNVHQPNGEASMRHRREGR